MKRPLVPFTLSLIAGITAAQTGSSHISAVAIFTVLIFSAVFLFLKMPDKRLIIVGILLFYSVGVCEYLVVDRINSNRYKEFSGDSQVVVRGFVDSEPDIREAKVLYVIRTENIIAGNEVHKVKGKILVTTLKNSSGYIYGYGRELEISGRLVIPKGKRNPGGFDYRRFLIRSGISATMFAGNDSITVLNGEYPNRLVKLGLIIRNRIVRVIEESLPKQQAALLNGMLIGYREGLSDDVQQAFSDAGLTHIMAVSGMNIAFIVLPLVFISRKLYLNQKVANTAIIAFLAAFLLVTGFTPSVVRAVIMAVIILIGQMLRREADIITSISLAAMLLLLYNPYMLSDVGFQLSFVATLSLVLFYKNIRAYIPQKYIPGFIAETIAVTLAAQIGVIPVTAFYFNKVSMISLLSNLIVVPLVQIVTVVGVIMAALGQVNILLSQAVGYLNSTFLSFILYVTKVSSQLPFAALRVVTPSFAAILLYYVVVLFFLWYKPKFKPSFKPVFYLIPIVLLTAIAGIYAIIPGKLQVVFIDIGEGDSTFIRSASGRTVLIDGGGYNSRLNPGANIGDTVIVPFLLDYGITKLDLVVATHGHDDHTQGLMPVLKDFEVGSFIIPRTGSNKEFGTLLDIANSRNIKTDTCSEGDIIKLDGKTFFTVLHPAGKGSTDGLSLNNTSLVLKLVYKNISILFPGDIEEEVENALVDSRENLEADVLKVAHHGSASSTKTAFLDHVKPRAAVISVGKNNFGHPAPLVVDELNKRGIILFRTDEDGAVVLKSDGKRLVFTKTVNN